MPGARMFCQKAMLLHSMKPKGCFGSPQAYFRIVDGLCKENKMRWVFVFFLNQR